MSYYNTSPASGDSSHDLIGKLLQVLGGQPLQADGTNALLRKLLNLAAGTVLTTDPIPSTYELLTYGSSVALDLDGAALQEVNLTGDVIFTTANWAVGKRIEVRVNTDGSQRSLSFPAGWTWVGSFSIAINANRSAVITLVCYGPAETDIVATFDLEPG